jgi:hypothetical protein
MLWSHLRERQNTKKAQARAKTLSAPLVGKVFLSFAGEDNLFGNVN